MIYNLYCGLCQVQGLNLLPIDPDEEEQGSHQADHLCNGEGPPYEVYIATQTQQIGRRQQRHHLTAKGGDGGIDAVTQRLEGSGEGNADGSDWEMDADDPQGDFSQFRKGGGEVKDAE